MPTVAWNLGAGESLANFVTSNTINGFSVFGFTLNGTGSRLLGFLNTNGSMTQPSSHTDSLATSFTFQNNSLAIVSVSGVSIDVDVFYQNHLLPNGIQDAIDYLFGTLGSGGNAYQGAAGAQVFEAFRNGDGFIGAAGNDVFELGRVTGVTDISYIHGFDTAGTANADTDTIRFVGAFNGTIHQISNIDAIVFDAATAVTFALDDTDSSLHNPLGNVLITTNVAGASLTLTQAGEGSTYWYTSGWTFAGSHTFDLTINTHAGDYRDFVIMDDLSQASHFGNVHINTYGGNDTIAGLGAHVVIDGGDGVDMLVTNGNQAAAGIDFDLLNSPNWAAFGYESVVGIEQVSMAAGAFDDTLSGGNYYDLIQGYSGNDSINGRGGNDILTGMTGNDTIRGGSDQDYIDGGADNDKLYGDDGNDQITASDGDDWVEGGNDDDYVGGGRGSDTMDGGSGVDLLSFSGDNTYVAGSHGVIVSLGTGGIDTDGSVYPADLDADAVAALLAIAGTASFTLAAGTALGADGSIDHFSNFEGLEGSQLDDFLIGSDGANALHGNSGDDWIFAEAGADTVYAGSGADHVYGGADADTLYGNSEDDTILGGAGDDTIDGGEGTGDVAVYAGAWTAFSFSGTGTITVDGTAAGEGTDQVSDVEFFTFNGKTVAADQLANVGPVGVNDSASITEASDPSPVTAPVTGNVLSNDTDANSGLGDTKTLTGVRAGLESAGGSLTSVSAPTIVQGTYGALTVNTDGSYSYALDSNLAATKALKGGAVVHDMFTYRIEDAHGSVDIAQIDVTVREKNDAPVITSPNGGAATTLQVNENIKTTTAVTIVHATDYDGPSITYSIVSGGDGSRFSINSATGALTFKAVPDFEKPADGNHNNVYTVQVKASDGALSDTQTLTITVKNLAGLVTGTAAGEKIDASHGVGGKFATGEEDKIDGKGGNDRLSGLAGNDTLIGGAGKDTLDGGSGADKFVFNAALSASTNVDTIVSFAHNSDIIQLENAIFTKLGSWSSAKFYAKAGATKAHDADDRIIYDKSSGKLYYDADGNKSGGLAAIHFATLTNKPSTLDHGDFGIV